MIWSWMIGPIRSSSVISGNTPVIDGGVLGEFHPMQEECEHSLQVSNQG